MMDSNHLLFHQESILAHPYLGTFIRYDFVLLFGAGNRDRTCRVSLTREGSSPPLVIYQQYFKINMISFMFLFRMVLVVCLHKSYKLDPSTFPLSTGCVLHMPKSHTCQHIGTLDKDPVWSCHTLDRTRLGSF